MWVRPMRIRKLLSDLSKKSVKMHQMLLGFLKLVYNSLSVQRIQKAKDHFGFGIKFGYETIVLKGCPGSWFVPLYCIHDPM